MRALPIALATFSFPAFAEDVPTIDQFLASLDGSKVTLSGGIGYDQDMGLGLVVQSYVGDLIIRTTPDLPSDQLEEIKDCPFGIIAAPCLAEMQLELNFSSGHIKAVVQDVQNVRPQN